MKAIWKFVFILDTTDISMPRGAKFLHVSLQAGEPCLWAIVDPQADKVRRLIRVRGTGYEIPDGDSELHIGTFQQGPYVWHVFDRGEIDD